MRIERVTSTAALSQHLQQQVLSQQDGGAIELETLTSQGQTGRRTDGDGQRRNPVLQFSLVHINKFNVSYLLMLMCCTTYINLPPLVYPQVEEVLK